jgi:hypothetical protein
MQHGHSATHNMPGGCTVSIRLSGACIQRRAKVLSMMKTCKCIMLPAAFGLSWTQRRQQKQQLQCLLRRTLQLLPVPLSRWRELVGKGNGSD